jgi:DNA-binding CsgD family transcriptional regulator
MKKLLSPHLIIRKYTYVYLSTILLILFSDILFNFSCSFLCKMILFLTVALLLFLSLHHWFPVQNFSTVSSSDTNNGLQSNDQDNDFTVNNFVAGVKEMKNRLDYFIKEKENSDHLVQSLAERMALLQRESDPVVISRELDEMQKLCASHVLLMKNSKNAISNYDADNELEAWLKMNYSGLTNQELHICSLLKNGMSTKEIAARMNITADTIFDYRKSIRRKLGLNNQRNEKLSEFLRSQWN